MNCLNPVVHQLLQCGDLVNCQCQFHDTLSLFRNPVSVYHPAASFLYVPSEGDVLHDSELFLCKVVQDGVPFPKSAYLVADLVSAALPYAVKCFFHPD